MKNFYFIIFISLYYCNKIHCADSNIKLKKGELTIKYEGIRYLNKEELSIDKNQEINIEFIKNLISKNDFLKQGPKFKNKVINESILKLDNSCNTYEIVSSTDKKGNFKIEDFKQNTKTFLKEKEYFIEIKKYYILPNGSKISVAGYSADLGGQKFYIDDFNFENKVSFRNSVFKKFKDLELKNEKTEKITLDKLDPYDYYIDSNFCQKFEESNNLKKDKFKKMLDNNEELNILYHKSRKYKIISLKLDENLEGKYKIVKEYKKKLEGHTLRFPNTATVGQIMESLNNNFFNGLVSITVNGNISIRNPHAPIKEDNINIEITDIDNKKLKNIVPKTAGIKIDSKENIFIIDKNNYKSKILNFVNDIIDTNTDIKQYIDKTYSELKGHYDLKIEGGKDGKFEDGTIITITIKDIIPNITTAKNQDKIHVKVNFKVSDDTKYKLKNNILKLNNNELELKKDSKYEDLIGIVKCKLGNTAFKNGFSVIFNNTIFTAGNLLTNNGIYTFQLNNLDTEFVEENNEEEKQEEGGKENNTNNEEEHNNNKDDDDNKENNNKDDKDDNDDKDDDDNKENYVKDDDNDEENNNTDDDNLEENTDYDADGNKIKLNNNSSRSQNGSKIQDESKGCCKSGSCRNR